MINTNDIAYAVMFQSTHPRGVRHRETAVYGTERVSIHAPARGATISVHLGLLSISVSIHAPARGATHLLNGIIRMVLFATS